MSGKRPSDPSEVVGDAVTRDAAASVRSSASRATWIQRAVYVAGVGGLLAQFVVVLARPAKYQWDFRAYFFGSRLFLAGHDAYDYSALARVAGAELRDDNLLPFIYPPHALLWFLPFALTTFSVAYYLFAATKLVALVTLLVLSARSIPSPWWRAFVPMLALLMFGGAVPADLRTGNIALFETVLLLLAAGVLVRRRIGSFGPLVVLASSWKLVLLPFTLVPLLLLRPRPWLRVVVSLAALPLVVFGWWVIDPAMVSSFLRAGKGLTSGIGDGADRGMVNGSVARVLADISHLVFGRTEFGVVVIGYLLLSSAVILLSARAWRLQCMREDRLRSISYLILVYGLVVPRMPLYSYVLMLVPCIYVLSTARRGSLAVAVAALGCIPFPYILRDVLQLDPKGPPTSVLLLPIEYAGLVVVSICWLLVTTVPKNPSTAALLRARTAGMSSTPAVD